MKLDQIKDNFDDACNDFIKKRNGKLPRGRSFLRNFLKFIDDMRADYVGQFVAQAAFFTILSAVPFLMLVILCLKYFVVIDLNSVINTINETFPEQVTVYLSQILNEVFRRSDSIATMSITVIAALWASSRGTMAIYCGLNQIAGYVRPYNWFSARIVSFFYNIIFMVVIIATGVILIFGNAILSVLHDNLLTRYAPLARLLRLKFPIFFVLLVLAFASIYTFLPQKKMKFRKQLVGAVTTALGWMIFSWLFSVYVDFFGKFPILYGSLTAVVLLMFWVFFCLYILLIGAEINKHIEEGFFRRVKHNVFERKPRKNK